jgi:hypothetical protein
MWLNQVPVHVRWLTYMHFYEFIIRVSTKKLIISHFFSAGSGSGPKRQDPDPTKKVRIRPDKDPHHRS